jgi:hypothetical protein
MSAEDGLVCAYAMDGKGGGRPMVVWFKKIKWL